MKQSKEPRNNPHSYRHLLLTKMPKIYVGEKKSASTNGAGKDRYLYFKNKPGLDRWPT